MPDARRGCCCGISSPANECLPEVIVTVDADVCPDTSVGTWHYYPPDVIRPHGSCEQLAAYNDVYVGWTLYAPYWADTMEDSCTGTRIIPLVSSAGPFAGIFSCQYSLSWGDSLRNPIRCPTSSPVYSSYRAGIGIGLYIVPPAVELISVGVTTSFFEDIYICCYDGNVYTPLRSRWRMHATWQPALGPPVDWDAFRAGTAVLTASKIYGACDPQYGGGRFSRLDVTVRAI